MNSADKSVAGRDRTADPPNLKALSTFQFTSMQAATDRETLEKLRQLVKDINIAMLTTLSEDGSLHSRPMSCNGEIDADGTLWFFTSSASSKVSEVNRQHQVNVSFADPHKQEYVAIAGTAELVQDKDKMAQLWQPHLKAWFPQELAEPDIALLKVTPTQAEYWDAPSGFVVRTLGFLKAVATGERASGAENEKIRLN